MFNKKDKMKFIITGSSGLIGSSLKKELERNGNKCVLHMDIREGKDVCHGMPHNKYTADIMFHLSSNCKINKSISDPSWGFENVIGIHQVIEFCRRNNIPKIVAFSSSRVLSKEKNPYTASKIYLEELCKSYAACYNIEYIIIRPSTVYGPFDDKTHRLVDIWIRAALNGNDLKIYGDPKTKTLDFTFIDDFIDGVILTLKKDIWNTEYNISGNKECNLYDLAEFITNKTNSTSSIIIEPAEIQQPQKTKLDISKMKGIGYSPKVNLEEGITRTIEFYIEHHLK